MTDFTKTKMHFALALLGTLFAVHEMVPKYGHLGFPYLNVPITFLQVYALMAILLALTVYCYAVSLLSEKHAPRAEKVGNYLYALSILIVPLYGLLYASSVLAREVGEEHWAVTGPSVAVGLAILWLVASQLIAFRLRERLGDQDRKAKLEQIVEQEIMGLKRSQEMMAESHYDLGVIEAWKAIEARLRRVLLMRGHGSRMDSADRLIDAAARAGILSEAGRKLLDEVRREWTVAISTEPLGRDAAEHAVQSARQLLSIIPVNDPAHTLK
jgi:hypothetical protein